MTTKLRLMNLALCTATMAGAWYFMPASETPRSVEAFGIPPCGLMQGCKLDTEESEDTICEDPGCEPPQSILRRKSVGFTPGWECLFEDAQQIQCNQNCSVIIFRSDQPCMCVAPTNGCPTGTEWNQAQCQCVPIPPPPPPPEDECQFEEPQPCGFNATDPFCYCETPIILSEKGNRLNLTDRAGGVNFDLNGDGMAERIAWTAPGEEAGFLAMDRNGNGLIDDGTELFGNRTPQPAAARPNGFLALALYDRPEEGGDQNGLISSRDAAFNRLRLWYDGNHDGISQASELHPLADLHIAEIELAYRESRRRDPYGNLFRYMTRVKLEADKGPKGSFAIDVIFTTR